MAKYVIMPKLSFNMGEGRIVKWLKKEGEKVQEQEPILQIETDKSLIDVESQTSGILRKILVQEGEIVPVTLPIGIIANPDEDIELMIQEALEKLGFSNFEHKEEKSKTEIKNELITKEVSLSQKKSETVMISPRARKKIKELGLDLNLIKKELSKKIIQEEDIIEFYKREELSKAAKSIGKVIAKEIPYDGIRKLIGDKLSHSKITSPHIYFATSVDMSNVIKILESFKSEKEINISVNDFIVFIVAKALTENIKLNSSLLDDKIVYYSSINIGIAVGLEDELVVPVIREADKKNLIEISKESKRLISLAREKKLLPEDYQNGTFTISNLGMYGIEEFTAIINPPEAAILAVGSIEKKPIVDEQGDIIIRPIMRVNLSVDHRIIDGLIAAKFLQSLKRYLLNPGVMLF